MTAMRTARALGAATACGILAGCVSAVTVETAPELKPIGADYRKVALAWAKGFFAQPKGLRSAYISRPLAARDRGGVPLWLVCVSVDARAADGASMGPRRYALGFVGSVLYTPLIRNQALLNTDCDLLPLDYAPWPELERL